MNANATGRVSASSLIMGATCEQLLAEDGNTGGCFDPQTHLITIDLDYRDRNIRSYQDLLRQFPTQNEHLYLLATSKRVTVACHSQCVPTAIVS
jgi:hypothetical protein